MNELSITEIKQKLLSPDEFPFSHSLFNMDALINENERFYMKLMNELEECRKNRQRNHQKNNQSKLENSRYTVSMGTKAKSVARLSHENGSVAVSFISYKKRNEFLRGQINKLRQQNYENQEKNSPELKEKKKIIVEKEKEIEEISQQNKLLKQTIDNGGEVFDLYEKMCRKCQNWRKTNNSLSEELKKYIIQLNELTGRDQNPNFYIMNLK